MFPSIQIARPIANASHRSDLSIQEREEYTRAVLCLQKKPPKAPKDKIPGALGRFDDFVGYHMTNAMMLQFVLIHRSPEAECC